MPTAVKMGAVSLELGAGLAVCAATQSEQVAASVWLGWLWVDSAAAVHNIRDRQSHTDQRTQMRIFRLRIRLASAYNGYPPKSNIDVSLWTRAFLIAENDPSPIHIRNPRNSWQNLPMKN
jgi:hypothetical protein